MVNLISERQFQETVIETFEVRNCLVLHISDSRKQVRAKDGTEKFVGDSRTLGYPDLTITRRNPLPAGFPEDQRVIWAELKREGANPTLAQREYLNELPPHRAFLWRPSSFEAIDRIAQQGHPVDGTPCETCWTCFGPELIKKRRPAKRIGGRRAARASQLKNTATNRQP